MVSRRLSRLKSFTAVRPLPTSALEGVPPESVDRSPTSPPLSPALEKKCLESRLEANLGRNASIRKVKRMQSRDSGFATLTPSPSSESLQDVSIVSSSSTKTEPTGIRERSNMSLLERKKLSMAIRRKLRTSTAKSEQPLVEEMTADLKRVIVASEQHVLLSLLINPNVDEYYQNFTVDFMLTYRYYMTEKELWQALEDRFKEWSEKAVRLRKEAAVREANSLPKPIASSESRVGRYWLLDDNDADKILIQ